MKTYTKILEDRAYDISPEDENYMEELMEVVKLFRYFDEALDEFLVNHGYLGDIKDVDEKISFIKTKFKQASVPMPRNLKKCFTHHKGIDKDTPFQFCFAFNLGLAESEAFLRKVCLKRGFDCHDIKEAIYYYAVRNRLSYEEAQSIIDQAPKHVKGSIDFHKDVLYTSSIIQEINRFQNAEELLGLFQAHLSQFGYNNATATKYVCRIWEEIAGEEGLAYQEACLLSAVNGGDIQAKRTFEDVLLNKERKDEKCTVLDEKGNVNDSTWNVYVQILGLDHYQAYSLPKDRSLKSVLKDNAVLHHSAEESFPDRQGIDAVLNGKHVSNERIRKIMILLLFYRYWAKLSVKNKNAYYSASNADVERCIGEINKYLLDTGYPELYLGNPYDWIFFWALLSEEPLSAFRYYIGELFAVKSEQF